MTWTLRPYQPGDESGILELRRAVFGGVDPIRGLPHAWKWQFQDNPAGPGFILLAQDGGRIVGQYAAIPVRMQVEGRPVLCGYSCDTMVHPDYRHQGMFVALASNLYRVMEKEHDVDTVWGFPNENSMHGFATRLGWQQAGPFFARVTLPRVSAFFKKGPEKSPVMDLGGGAEARPLERFGPEFDQLWQEHGPQKGVAQVRDAAYLNWRYGCLRDFGYKSHGVFMEGRAVGYFVLRSQMLSGVRASVLADVFPLPMVNHIFSRGLLKTVARHAAREGRLLLVGLFSRRHEKLARACGFHAVPERAAPKVFRLAGRFSRDLRPAMALPENWLLSLGDTDVI